MEEDNCRTEGLKYNHTFDGESTIKTILPTVALMEGAIAVGMEAPEYASRKEEVR
jgi:hypothetical protein